MKTRYTIKAACSHLPWMNQIDSRATNHNVLKTTVNMLSTFIVWSAWYYLTARTSSTPITRLNILTKACSLIFIELQSIIWYLRNLKVIDTQNQTFFGRFTLIASSLPPTASRAAPAPDLLPYFWALLAKDYSGFSLINLNISVRKLTVYSKPLNSGSFNNSV